MYILIKNANLISMSENRERLEKNIDILIHNNKIEKIDKDIKIDENITGNVKVIDGTDKIVMPGLINTHSHISMSFFRETVDGYQTQDWLTKEIWPREDKLTGKDIYWGAKLSEAEAIMSGTTTINDMYFFTEDVIQSSLNTGLRIQTTRTLMGYEEKDLDRLKELDDLIQKHHEDIISFNVGIHGLYTSNEKYVEKCVEFAREKNLPIHIHFCENQKEREDIIRDYKVKEPTEVLLRDFEGTHTILAHSVKLSDKDIENIKDKDFHISTCPVSNLKLGCGIAPLSKMAENGLNISIGTDGQGSGSNLDLFETMKYVPLLQKGINENPKLFDAYDVLKMATINGAKALCLDDKIGTIEQGKVADLIILNTDSIMTKPVNNIFAELVYNFKGTDVNTTIVNGKILMENRKLKFDLKETIKNCEEIIKRIS